MRSICIRARPRRTARLSRANFVSFPIDVRAPNLSDDIETSSSMARVSLAMSQGGAALCDPLSPTMYPEKSVRVLPFDPGIPLPYGAMLPRNAHLDPSVETLPEHLKDEFGNAPIEHSRPHPQDASEAARRDLIRPASEISQPLLKRAAHPPSPPRRRALTEGATRTRSPLSSWRGWPPATAWSPLQDAFADHAGRCNRSLHGLGSRGTLVTADCAMPHGAPAATMLAGIRPAQCLQGAP